MNNLMISGNLGKDPELKNLDSGKTVCNFTVADNVKKDKTIWWSCVAWGKTAEAIAEYFQKGQKIICVGFVDEREWENKDGEARKTMELNVQKFDFGGKSSGAGGSVPSASAPSAPKADQEDDNLPF